MDVFTPQERSRVMAAVRSKENASTELRLLAHFRQNKIGGWRRGSLLFGKPDFVFRTQKVAVFVDGCFWHSCSKCFRMPVANRDYWRTKTERNKARDRDVAVQLSKMGWRVIRIFECTLRDEILLRRKLATLQKLLSSRSSGFTKVITSGLSSNGKRTR